MDWQPLWCSIDKGYISVDNKMYCEVQNYVPNGSQLVVNS